MGARVLVVDDSPTIRKLVSAILAHHDYDPVAAPDGQTGLDRLREGGIDLVLLDFVMPRMNGYQFCLELRADEKLRNVPVVLMSAKGDKIRGQFVQQTGAVDAITKPFDARGLVAVVESALQKAASGRLPVVRGDATEDEITEDSEVSPDLLSAQARLAAGRRSFFDEAVGELAETLAGALGAALDIGLGSGVSIAANGSGASGELDPGLDPAAALSGMGSTGGPRFGESSNGDSGEPGVSFGSTTGLTGDGGSTQIPNPSLMNQVTATMTSGLSEAANQVGSSSSWTAPGNSDGLSHTGGDQSSAVPPSVGRLANGGRSARASMRTTPHRGLSTPHPIGSYRPESNPTWSDVTGLTSARGAAPVAAGASPSRPATRSSVPVRDPNTQLAAVLRQLLTPEFLQVLAPAMRRLGIGGEPFGGDTDVIPLAEVMQLLQLQRQTGTCRITNGRVEVTVCFRDGLIDLAIGRGAGDEFRLGRYLIAEGLVSREDLDRVLQRERVSQRKIGEKLIKFGMITEAELRRALTRQTSELLYEVLRWPNAHFSFVKDVLEQPEVARLGLPVASIVMEGFRRVDEWRLIEETIQFDQVLLRDQVALDALGPGAKLSRHEQQLLEAIDGQRTVREILGRVDLGAFDACKILYQFLQSRLVRQRAA